MTRFRCPVLLLLAIACVLPLHARDAFVMLSGGVSPWANNYSQYLQARAVVTWLEQNYPRDSVWAFFGAGNVTGEEPFFCDVRREEIRDGKSTETWLAGSVSRNRPAQREIFLKALREEILPTVADGGTLYLFVGDHGSQSRGTNAESVIDMWGLERDEQSDRKWRTIRNTSLRVSDLRQTLAQGLGRGRVVFCMTQCHSGGFHHLGIPRVVTPNARWFTTVPAWLTPKTDDTVFVRAAGYTATDERSLAAGCQADPDYLRWAGYERYVPQVLFGWDLFELQPSAKGAKGLRSFAEAHEAATLIDQTIDKPYSTSEQYLERWANFIETRLLRETNLAPDVKRQLTKYQRTVDGATPKELNLLFRQRQAQFRRFTERLAEQSPANAKLLLGGTRKELEEAAGLTGRSGRTNTTQTSTNRVSNRTTGSQTNTTTRATTNATARVATNAPTETQKQWKSIRPAWTDEVESGRASRVVGAALEFEKFLLREEAKGRDNFSTTSRTRLREEAFWQAGYSTPRTLDVKTAEAVMRWSTDRRSNITAWARSSPEEEIRAAGEKLVVRTAPRTNTSSTLTNKTTAVVRTNAPAFAPRPVSRRIAAERVLFYRRTLAAWEFLLALNERPALAQVRTLTELEHTPLPPPGK